MTHDVTKKINRQANGKGRVAASIAAATFAGFSAVCLTAAPTHAQSGAVGGPLGGALLRHYDVFAGIDKVGPYVLSWNRLRVSRDDRVVVVIDGTTLPSDSYTIDTLKGTITFRQPLAANSLARVSYSYDPKVAQRNEKAASAPVTVPLLNMGGIGALRVTALPNANSSSKDTADGPGTPMIWSMGGKSSLLGGGLESLVNFAGPNGTAMKMGYKMGNDKNGVQADFNRTERRFAAKVGQRMGLADPTQKLSLAARLAPSKWLGTGYTSVKSSDLSTKAAKDTNTLSMRLGGVSSAPTLNFTRISDSSLTPDKKETTVGTDKLELGALIGKAIALAATGNRVETDTPVVTSNSKTEDMAVSLTAQSADKTQQAVVSVSSATRETTASLEDKRNVALKLQPAPSLVLSAEQKAQTVTPIQDGKQQPETSTTIQTATAEIAPAPLVKISGAVIQTTTATPAPAAPADATASSTPPAAPQSVTVSSTDLSARVGEGKAVELAAGVTNRSTDSAGQSTLDTTRAQVALRPMGGLTLTGGYTWNPEDRDRGKINQALRQEFGIKAKVGGLELGSGYALTTLNGLPEKPAGEPQFGEVSFTLGVRFDAQTTLSGTYKDSLRYRSAEDLPAAQVPLYLKAYNLDFKRDLGQDLNIVLGGSYTLNRALERDPKEIKAEARIGVRF